MQLTEFAEQKSRAGLYLNHQRTGHNIMHSFLFGFWWMKSRKQYPEHRAELINMSEGMWSGKPQSFGPVFGWPKVMPVKYATHKTSMHNCVCSYGICVCTHILGTDDIILPSPLAMQQLRGSNLWIDLTLHRAGRGRAESSHFNCQPANPA